VPPPTTLRKKERKKENVVAKMPRLEAIGYFILLMHSQNVEW
jgi:hypothetical protein